ncbi:hypothetical protein SALBM311S_10828 [Streptomyces alboniger]
MIFGGRSKDSAGVRSDVDTVQMTGPSVNRAHSARPAIRPQGARPCRTRDAVGLVRGPGIECDAEPERALVLI